MTKAKAINQWWGQFLTAYEEHAVPDNAQYPYISYNIAFGAFDDEVLMSATVWYRDTSWVACNAKTQEISDAIGRGGVILPCDGGAVYLKREPNFAQAYNDTSDDTIKAMLITLSAEYLTES